MDKRPILFSGPMVRAILDGRKTQTRRVITKKPAHDALATFGADFLLLPGNVDLIGYAPADRLWVRETWQGLSFGDYQPTKSNQCDVRYKATDRLADLDTEARGYPWRPSIFMPRWASRLTLTVTDVRVQRLQDISEDDARAEGCPCQTDEELAGYEARGWFRDLWDSLNAARGFGWDANPWVCAVTFTAHQRNIDQMEEFLNG